MGLWLLLRLHYCYSLKSALKLSWEASEKCKRMKTWACLQIELNDMQAIPEIKNYGIFKRMKVRITHVN